MSRAAGQELWINCWEQRGRLERRFRARSVSGGHDDRGFLDFDQPATAAFFELRKDGVDLFPCLDEFDLDGQMVRDLQDVRGMHPMRGSKAGYAFDHRGAGDAAVKEIVEDAGVDGDAVMFGSIAEIE